MTPVDPAPAPDAPADPAAPTAPRRRSRRVVRPGTEQAGVAGLGSDDDAAVWGDVRPGASTDSHDAELLRDVPPHWS
ncbi:MULTISPECIES: hypothetical protein [Oerskovia]|uniref:Transcriptional regulator n=2 Tax=Oerskovia TaxID=162491 RepID=A0ABR8V3P5_9CELL|nr:MULTISPECIES: hypothetical protein [Oerskovia]MBD7999402.1 hypothetical protein [Oerskovia gallyi]MBM7498554.1 hypothetical protein [Oerskovia paurometabola]